MLETMPSAVVLMHLHRDHLGFFFLLALWWPRPRLPDEAGLCASQLCARGSHSISTHASERVGTSSEASQGPLSGEKTVPPSRGRTVNL